MMKLLLRNHILRELSIPFNYEQAEMDTIKLFLEKRKKNSNIDLHKINNKAMRLEKIDLLEWGWHKTGDPSKPKNGFVWSNPDWPEFYLVYDELEGWASVIYKYAKGGSDAYNSIVEIYRFMDIHKGYEHEQDFGL